MTAILLYEKKLEYLPLVQNYSPQEVYLNLRELIRTRILDDQSRGRPRGKSKLYESALKSVVLVARKNDLDPKLLIDAFVETWRNKTYSLGTLKCSCREVDHNFVIFLLTNEDKVVSQFPINIEILRNPEFFKNHLQNIQISSRAKVIVDQRQRKIGDLRFGMKGVNLRAKIINITPKKLVITRMGTQSYVSNVTIADETGSMMLSLWNVQIDLVHVGDEIEIKNCYVASFGGASQLRIGRKGIVSVVNSYSKGNK